MTYRNFKKLNQVNGNIVNIDPSNLSINYEKIGSTSSLPIKIYQNTNLGPWMISQLDLSNVNLSNCEKIIIRYWSYYYNTVKNQAHKHEFQNLNDKLEVNKINNKRVEILKNFKVDEKTGISRGPLKTAVIHISNYYYDNGEQKVEICEAPCCDLTYVSSTNYVELFGYRSVCADVLNNKLLISMSLMGDDLCVIDSIYAVFRP